MKICNTELNQEGDSNQKGGHCIGALRSILHTIGEGVQKCHKDVIKDGKVISEDEIIGAS